MTNALATYMKNLPQPVRDIEDTKRMSRLFGGEAMFLGWRGTVRRTIEQIEPDELIYIFTWGTTNRITYRMDGKTEKQSCALFFSNKRFLSLDIENSKIVEFPISGIRTVAARKGLIFNGVSFCTDELSMEITFASCLDVHNARDMIIHIAATMPIGLELTSSSLQSSIMNCLGCGAAVIVQPDTMGKCEYCNRPTQHEIAIVPETNTQSIGLSNEVVAELKKYKELLDIGVINIAEFESVKTRLLGKL